ncbi:hypothetical protein BGX26_009054 [Mortierella sp. AD094]|nr:hypothetical protein BGX26_009054 [Mortierella sp. AD094]
MQQPPTRPLIAEIEQLRRSVDSMNSQTAEILRNLENLRHIGADHMALPSTEQEKLDREWEYFETVCDQVYFILENAKYKLKRQQNALHQQLNPLPAPTEDKLATPDQLNAPTDVNITPSTSAPAIQLSAAPPAAPGTLQGSASPLVASSTPQPPKDTPTFDMEMLSPPSNFNTSSTPERISTASLLSAAAVANISNVANVPSVANVSNVVNDHGESMMDDTLISEEDKLQDTMLDLGDIGNLGGDMDETWTI